MKAQDGVAKVVWLGEGAEAVAIDGSGKPAPVSTGAIVRTGQRLELRRGAAELLLDDLRVVKLHAGDRWEPSRPGGEGVNRSLWERLVGVWDEIRGKQAEIAPMGAGGRGGSGGSGGLTLVCSGFVARSGDVRGLERQVFWTAPAHESVRFEVQFLAGPDRSAEVLARQIVMPNVVGHIGTGDSALVLYSAAVPDSLVPEREGWMRLNHADPRSRLGLSATVAVGSQIAPALQTLVLESGGPRDCTSRLVYAAILEAAGLEAAALRTYVEVLEIEPGNADAHLALAGFYTQRKMARLAAYHLREYDRLLHP